MKKFAAFLAMALAVTFSAGLVIGATAPDTVTIKEVQKSKAPVVFHHKAHTTRAKDCQVCHHKDAPGKEQKCFNCHKATAEGKVVALKEAFHTTCRDCHKKMNGPTKCNDCHKK